MKIQIEKHECDNCCFFRYRWFDKKDGSKICTDCLVHTFAERENCTVKINPGYTTAYFVGNKRIGGNRSEQDYEKLVKNIVKHFDLEEIEFE